MENTPKSSRVKKLLRFLANLAAGVALATFFYIRMEPNYLDAPATDAARFWAELSDATFLSGSLLGGFGLLMLISTTGFFDVMAYGAKCFWTLFTPFAKEKRVQDYYAYKQEKAANRGKTRWETFLVGVLLLAVSGFALWMFHRG